MKCFFSLFILFFSLTSRSQVYTVSSPDGKTVTTVIVSDKITYSIGHNQNLFVLPSEIGLHVENIITGWKVKKTGSRLVKQVITPVVREKFKTIIDQFNEFNIDFKNNFSLSFRVYNNGVAYRWQVNQANDLTILDEKVSFSFAQNDSVYYPLEDSFYSHNERNYIKYAVKDIGSNMLASLPALVDHQGMKMLITEADLYDYAGLWLRGDNNGTLVGSFPNYPAEEKQTSNYDIKVLRRENFIAKTKGPRTFPWRIIMIAEQDGDLITNQLVYQLSRETKEDFSWVKPGKVAWDWWNALNLYDVNFRSGINTQTYEYYIDFAAKYGIEYIIMDEGWSKDDDILSIVPAINMQELTNYAKQKNVGIILWVLWTSLNKQMNEALDQYQKWGIKGVKVDFMQRDDQKVVNFYEKAAMETAKRHLLIDFHGAFKPTGLQRLYPNALTREGVYGMEQSKWDTKKKIGPDHNVTLPFIRMAAGPMDFTPGAMLNAQKNDWTPIFNRPMSLGTRCHQLAMYAVFESPIQMLADNPSNYYREPECMEWLSKVPVQWDNTKVLQAKVGEYIALARQSSTGDWYLGAMTNWSARDMNLDFSFLSEGDYKITIWQDGVNADRVAIDYKRTEASVNKSSVMNIHLAPGGGWAAIITRK